MGVSKVRSLQGSIGILSLGAVAEAAFVHLNSDASVGIPERHSLKGPSVYLLDGEEVVVDSRFQDVRADLNVLKHIPGHLQTIVHQFEGWEKDVLEQLEITVVAVREIAAEQVDFVLRPENPVAVPPDYFPDIRIFLVRHYAGAGRQFVRKFYESEIRTHVEAAVRSQLVEGQCNGTHCRGNRPLASSPAQLCCNGIVIHRTESEQVRSHLSVKRKGTSIACG